MSAHSLQLGRGAALVLAGAAWALCASSAWAHGGGFYVPKPRDVEVPGPVGPPPPTGGTATTGSGNRAATPGESAEARLGPDDCAEWWMSQRWSLFPPRQFAVSTPSSAASDGGDRGTALALLRAAMNDPDEDVSTGAIVALGRLRDVESEVRLAAILVDESRNQSVRESAAMALAQLPVRAEGGFGRAALERVAVTSSGIARLRAIAVLAIGLRGDVASSDALSGLAMSGRCDPQVASAAATALGLVGGADARPVLETIAERGREGPGAKDPARVYAVHGLAVLGGDTSLPLLRKLVFDPDPAVRRGAALAIGRCAAPTDDASHSALRRRLDQDPEISCRNVLVLSMGRQGHEKAKAVIEDAVGGGRGTHRTYALVALGLWARAARDPAAAAAVRRSLRPESGALAHAAACIALAIAGDSRAAPILVRTVDAGGIDPFVRAAAAATLPMVASREEAVPVLRRVLTLDSLPGLRREAAIALGMFGDAESSKLLSEMAAGDGHLYVKGAAMVALGRLGGRAASDRLQTTLASTTASPILRALAAVGLGILFEDGRARPLHAVAEDLDWASSTDAVREILTVL